MLRSKMQSFREYFSTARPIVRLAWRASPSLFIASLGLTLFTGLLPAVNIFLTSALLETLVQATSSTEVNPVLPTNFLLLLVLLAGANLVGQVIERLASAASVLQRTRVSNHVQMLIAEKAAEIDLAEFENPEFHNRMRTAAEEAPFRPQMMIDELTVAFSMLTTAFSLSAVLLLWQWWIVPVIFVASLATLWVSTRFGKARVDLVTGRAETERKKQYSYALLTSDQAVKEIRLFSLRRFLLSRFGGLLETTYRQDRRLAYGELAYSVPAGVALAAVQAALFAFTAFQALQGSISIGQFSLYTQSILQVEGQLTSLMLISGTLHESNLFATSLFGFLATEPRVEAPRPGSAVRLKDVAVTPRVEFRNVSFAYPGTARTVLADVSFEVQPGEAIAVVGGNGAGKTTLVKLLAGLYEPTGGQILLDGVDVQELDRDDLRSYLSMIFQDYTIYHFSARENIGVGQVNCLGDSAMIEDAARRSGLDRVIEKLPMGYETVLGRFWESGHELSGGQRQLVALARALLRNAPILVLDEPSAALDISTEQRFFQSLLGDRDAQRARTVIFISHRFTSVRRANRILVLGNGRLVDQGTHEELVAQGGPYAEMFGMQARMYDGPRPTPATTHETGPVPWVRGSRT